MGLRVYIGLTETVRECNRNSERVCASKERERERESCWQDSCEQDQLAHHWRSARVQIMIYKAPYPLQKAPFFAGMNATTASDPRTTAAYQESRSWRIIPPTVTS